jgi:hypothetical protein
MWNRRDLRLSRLMPRQYFAAILVAVAVCGSYRLVAQSDSDRPNRVGLPQDWSHNHVVFSNPSNVQTLVSIRQDPRLLHQLLKRNTLGLSRSLPQQAPETGSVSQDQDFVADEQLGTLRAENQKRIDWSVTLGATGSGVARGMYPAKYSFDPTLPPDCVNDFAAFPTSLAGTPTHTQATIVAYNQLYSRQGVVGGFCNHNGPSVKWAYDTGGAIRNSPVLSLDGKKIAWVESLTLGILHVLTIGTTGANGTSVTAPAIPGAGNNAVDVTVSLRGGTPAGGSSLFVDYLHDVGYTGDNRGFLHKIAGLFHGTPAEVVTGGWPIRVFANAHLRSPVIDLTTNNIFMTDSLGHLLYVREVGSTSGICATGAPPCLGSTFITLASGAGFADPAIVDSSTGRVFTETANADGTNSQILQTDTALGSVVTVNVGAADGPRPLHNGAFDNNYVNKGASTGFYYVCGKNALRRPTLYRIGFNGSGVMNSAVDAATIALARGLGECSPATEFFNTGSTPQKDWYFVSVSSNCAAVGGGNGGCIMSFDITAGMPAAASHVAGERGGTSGIVVDNVSQSAQASSIYFSNLANAACGDGIATGGCAVKLTQSALQ